jgi:CRISPR-associated endonuclease/helicase Cas3
MYSAFFKTATGNDPYDYQWRLAGGDNGTDVKSQLINIPTGLGKTAAVVMAWLWNRVHLQNSLWPRRLVYCLPMRTLVEQTETVVKKWLAAHELDWDGVREDRKGKVGVHVLMGGQERGEWDIYPEENAILIGTQDMLLSRALNRGYGMSRHRWPMQFALLNNDCLWVLDETQLMGVGVETSAQLSGLRQKLTDLKQNAGINTWWMSATLDESQLATIDHPRPSAGWRTVRLDDADLKTPSVNKRRTAVKAITPTTIAFSADAKKSYPGALAEFIRQKHQQGELTLVIVNQVSRAQDVYEALVRLKLPAKLGLIHSRFRPVDRKARQSILFETGDRIVVATQAIEAGVDVSSRVLITELAPWPSLVQRFGRCNRAGEFDYSAVHWVDIQFEDDKETRPYTVKELAVSRRILKGVADVNSAELEAVDFTPDRVVRPVIRRKDLLDLFDTTPDLAGQDLDISRYIRDGDDTDVQVFWRDLRGKAPDPEEEYEPDREELCRVSLPRFRDFAGKLNKNKLPAYVWNQLEERWMKAERPHAGCIYLLDIRVGGYNSTLGWTGETADLKKEQTWVALVSVPSHEKNESYGGNESSLLGEPVTLEMHTADVVLELRDILKKFPNLEESQQEVLVTAASWHDVGKAYHEFQRMLGAEKVLLAKSASRNGRGRLKKPRQFFRHELASALAWLQAGPKDHAQRDLVAYLIAAHHGKVRLSIRSLPNEKPPTDCPDALIARGVVQGDRLGPVEMPGVTLPIIELDLRLMRMGNGEHGESWLSKMLALRDSTGLFRLAFMEALLRAADMRASAKEKKKDVRL